MPTAYAATSIAGTRFELQHRSTVNVAGCYSGTLYAFDGVTVPLRSTSHDICWGTAVSLLGVEFGSRYSHSAGELHLGSYIEEPEDEGIGETHHVALWTDGEVALWTETPLRAREWLADLFGALRPRHVGSSVVARGGSAAAFDTVDEDLLVTFVGIGALQLFRGRRWRVVNPAPGSRTPAGELFRGGPDEMHVELHDGLQRAVDKLFLRSSTAVAKLDLVDTDAATAVEFMSDFERVEEAA